MIPEFVNNNKELLIELPNPTFPIVMGGTKNKLISILCEISFIGKK